MEQADAIGMGKGAAGKEYPALYLIGTVSGISGIFRSDDTGGTWVRINDDQHQFGAIGPVIGDTAYLRARVCGFQRTRDSLCRPYAHHQIGFSL